MKHQLEAELYAMTHRGNAGDVAFYAGLCARDLSVLELGSGYGRLLPALAKVSHSVVGLEIDPALLGAGRALVRGLPATQRRRVKLTLGDMQSFALKARVDRIFLPYNALCCLLTQRSLRACLRSVRAALKPGGIFAFDVWNADGFVGNEGRSIRQESSTGRQSEEPLFAVQYAGKTWDVFEITRLRKDQKRLDTTYRYVPLQRGQTHTVRIPQRYFSSNELIATLTSEGFVVRSKHGDFAAAPFRRTSPQLVITATPR